MRFIAAILIAALLGAGTQAGEDKVIARNVLPSLTDSRIDTFSSEEWEHWVYINSSAPQRNQLLVFIPGTGGRGHGAKAFCHLAANEGFHVVSLAYPSLLSVSKFHESSDPDAFLKARENIIYGKPYKELQTNEANSILNRLTSLVRYLAKQFPDENWQQYLSEKEAVDWSKLVLAGQSQGGGHAGLLGMQHEVARVLMFGAPKDFNVHFDKPAKWLSAPSKTPLNRFFSFVHSSDEHHGCSYPQQLENYRALKLMPKYAVINVDDVAAPFDHSRLLTSKRTEESPHTSVIDDRAFGSVWKYMLNEPVE